MEEATGMEAFCKVQIFYGSLSVILCKYFSVHKSESATRIHNSLLIEYQCLITNNLTPWIIYFVMNDFFATPPY